MAACGASFGPLLGFFWGLLGASWGAPWGPEACWGLPGGPWGLSGASWGILFPLSGPFGGHLGVLLARLGRLLGCLEALLDRLEALLGRLGARLGASWAALGRSCRPPGPSWSVGKQRRRESQKPSKTNWKLTILASRGSLGTPLRALLGRIGGLLDRLEAIWGAVERHIGDSGPTSAVMEPPGTLVCRFWSRLRAVAGASWAVLGLSWAVLGPS